MSTVSTKFITDFCKAKVIIDADCDLQILEIGTASGHTTKKILKEIENRGTLYCCDPFIEYYDKPNRDHDLSYQKFIENSAKWATEKNLYFKRSKSSDFLISLNEMGLVENFDLIFIDGDHSTEAVANDFKLSKDLLKIGGFILFDDYNWIPKHDRQNLTKNQMPKPQVKIAVDKIIREEVFSEQQNYRLIDIKHVYPEHNTEDTIIMRKIA